jgi:hypothetical protein
MTDKSTYDPTDVDRYLCVQVKSVLLNQMQKNPDQSYVKNTSQKIHS